MKISLILLFILISSGAVFGADELKLEPNATLHFEFPDLPDTLMTMLSGKKEPAKLSAQLPENYAHDGKFPLFIFLGGGEGGRGDMQAVGRGIVGARDFICVSLPLFKRAVDKTEPYGGMMISMDDFETISHAYRAMLQKLLDAVPNISFERSTIGGFSNGAHTTGILLAGQDKFMLDHFQAFFFIDGGFGPLAANVLQKTSLKRCRFLMFLGDQPAGAGRDAIGNFGRALEWGAKDRKLDFTLIIMQGHGHEMPPKYLEQVGRWARGEKLPEAEKK